MKYDSQGYFSSDDENGFFLVHAQNFEGEYEVEQEMLVDFDHSHVQSADNLNNYDLSNMMEVRLIFSWTFSYRKKKWKTLLYQKTLHQGTSSGQKAKGRNRHHTGTFDNIYVKSFGT